MTPTPAHRLSPRPLLAAAIAALAIAPAPLAANAPDAPTATSSTSGAAAMPQTPEALYDSLTDVDWAKGFDDAQTKAAKATLESAIQADPKDGRWVCALAVLLLGAQDTAAAVELTEKAVKLAPGNARVHYWRGASIFGNMNNVGMFGKLGAASDGKAAFEKAVELDPTYIAPRLGLIQFYTQAPGIAGGSMKKAREQAQAIIALGGKGIYAGHVSLAQIAVQDKDFKAAATEFRAAADGAADNASRAQALAGLALLTLQNLNDPRGALALCDEIKPLAARDDSTPSFVAGQAHRALKQYPEAIADFRAVLVIKPKAVNTRYFLADCLAETGDVAGAIKVYEEFLEIAPSDPRTDEVAGKIKKLKKKLAN